MRFQINFANADVLTEVALEMSGISAMHVTSMMHEACVPLVSLAADLTAVQFWFGRRHETSMRA
jgi:hypothetical protein